MNMLCAFHVISGLCFPFSIPTQDQAFVIHMQQVHQEYFTLKLFKKQA